MPEPGPTAAMDQPTLDPPGKPASEDVTAVLRAGARSFFNALMPERFNKPSPLWNTLIPGKSEELHSAGVVAAAGRHRR